MTYLIIALAALAALAFVLLTIYDHRGLLSVNREIQDLEGVSDVDKVHAALCMQQAQASDRKTRIYDLSAPIVMLFVLPWVKREANALPKLFGKWDNNISLNGDSGGVLVDGKWIDYHDVQDWEAVQGNLMVTYDDPRYEGDAYYAKGHHPRSFWARYVWVGLRNRASKLALDRGRPVDGPIEVLSGSVDIGTRKAGHFLLKCGDTYHYKSARPFKLLGFELVRVRSYGFKLEIAAKNPGTWEAERVAVVAIGWSAKRWKGGA